jgi:glycerol-3-phosphate dehydrogenase (NAD(P)+)
MGRIGIIGGGAWGTALAGVARRNLHDVTLWVREAEAVEAINHRHENPLFLPGVTLDPAITATATLADAVAGAEAVLLATPAQHTREIAAEVAPHLPADAPLVICAKGIELRTGALMSEAVWQAAPGRPIAVLSGPTFAAEVARGLPTAVTLAAHDQRLGERLMAAIGSRTFRPYWTDDVIGAQIGGAVKNVLAIACGIVEGRKLGDNARAALITRGLAEMMPLGVAKGARTETLFGLSGLGDLTLTCNGRQSRNMSLGIALGRGETLADVLGARRSVAEGVSTAAAVTALAARLEVEMPICAAVDAILHHDANIDAVIEELLARPFKAELPQG